MAAVPTCVLQQYANRFLVEGQGLEVIQVTTIVTAPALSGGVVHEVQIHLQTASSIHRVSSSRWTVS